MSRIKERHNQGDTNFTNFANGTNLHLGSSGSAPNEPGHYFGNCTPPSYSHFSSCATRKICGYLGEGPPEVVPNKIVRARYPLI
jgi:hypothetical protein